MAQVRVPIEIDITYVNKTWFTTKKKSNVKHYVIGIFQRGVANVPGKAIIKALPDNKPETIIGMVVSLIKSGAMIYAEENILPDYLKEHYEIHELKSSENERVRGDIHVNNVKNMWKDLKRNIKQTHIQVSKKHLQGYCDEVAWRINHKHLTPFEKFNLLLSNCEGSPGKKRTYKDIIK